VNGKRKGNLDVAKMIKDGIGTGKGDEYKTWIKI